MRSMWIAVALAAAVGCTSPGAPPEPESESEAETGATAERGPRYLSIGADALDAARAVAARRGAPLDVIESDGDVAVIELPAQDLGALAAEIHARHDRCGGFELHDSLADAHAALLHAHDAARPGPDYTIDRPAEVRAVLPQLDAARIAATIAELSAMKNRYYRSDSGAAAATWLRDRWRSFSTRRRVTVELVDTGYPQKSVVMTIPGTTRASEVIVIGGHLDSIAIGGTSSTAPGADDDASGIATLTEVARVLLAGDYRPARTIQLMAYAAEEVGLRGSLQIARDYKQRGINVVGALQLDMTNFHGSDKDIWLMKDFTSAPQNAFLGRLIDTYVGATWGYDACGYACSDHAAWHRIGVPASMPFEARFAQANRLIHTNKDTLETSGANAAHAVKFARLAAAYAIELGKGELPAPPTPPAELHTAAGDPAPAPADSTNRRAAATAAVLMLIASTWALRSAIART
ncbi:MAG TPA: M20/M25/M40 family metallo-hydrolase [Kofleriaceae bacterium]|nr:M20/M25/M40 family metallo-hydrolase [Kofleriaceae bacterium]